MTLRRANRLHDGLAQAHGAFQSDHRGTAAFAEALLEQGLLIDHQLQARTRSGAVNLQGFKVVDRAKFANLPDAVMLEWHKAGYLPLIHFHLASLDRFQDLLGLLHPPSAVDK